MSVTQETPDRNAVPFYQADAVFQQFCSQGQTIVQSLNQWNAEFARFVGERISHNAQAFGRIVECCRMSDTIDAELQWVRDAFDDYARESSHLMEANQKFVAAWIGAAGQAATHGETAKINPPKAPVTVAA
jgi:hypothetical protein